MIDVGTLGSSPVLVSINKILIEINNPVVTNKVCSIYLAAKNNFSKLKKYVKDKDVKFYRQMLDMLRDKHVAAVINQVGKIPDVLQTHLCCAVVGLYQEAIKEVKEQTKESCRRIRKGQQPL